MALFVNTYCEGKKREQEKWSISDFEPSFNEYFALAAQYSTIENFVFVGATHEFRALYTALGKYRTTKNVFFAENDPASIHRIKKKCSSNTLVVVVDETGEDKQVLMVMLALKEFQKLIITKKETTLKSIQEQRDLAFIEFHKSPKAISPGVIVPAVLLYINAQEFVEGAKHMYGLCHPNNARNGARNLAFCLSERVPRIKFFGCELQGGYKLVEDLNVKLKEEVHVAIVAQSPIDDIHINADLGMRVEGVEGASMHQQIIKDFEAWCLSAKKKGIPLCTITIDKTTPYAIGELLAFWECTAKYMQKS